MRINIVHICFLLYILLLMGCNEENQPNNPIPEIFLKEAEDITRTSARLSGTIVMSPQSHTNLYRFQYGVTQDEVLFHDVQPDENGDVSVLLDNLTPGTTYYYNLEVGNKLYQTQSQTLKFTTLPNKAPTIGDIKFLGQGPISIILQCTIIDNGGENVTAKGFVYTAEGGEKQELTAPYTTEDQWQLRIGGLQKNTSYTVQAFAENSIGRTYSEPYAFQTKDAVILTSAGTLAEIIEEEEKYNYTELSIAGAINGTDLRLIRDMAGRDTHNEISRGQLTKLDLTDAQIVEGGLPYWESRYTKDNIIGYAMFGDLDRLQEIKLPTQTSIIEQNAFKNCISLTTLSIPAAVTEVTSSDGCERLNTLSVMPGNTTYTSIEGIIYTQNGEELIWYPEGMIQETLTLSPTLTSIGELALQNCKVSTIILPNSLTQIGKQAFHNASIKSIILPDAIQTIPYGAFQGCTQLTSVTLGSQCEMLSSYCFDLCPLQHLYVKSTLPPTCNTNTFTGAEEIFDNCILHVPNNSKDIYRNHETWGRFKNIEGE